MKNSRWLSLIVLCTGFLLIVVDMTIVNVALPSIQMDLGFSQSGLAWVVNAYLIAFGGLLLLAGRVGDLAGRKRVYLAGLVIFPAASVLCGLSFAQPMLIAARFVQGVGGAVSSAVILAMIVTLFPEPLERAKAFGIFSFVASAGAAVGLIAGGLITQAVSWHWIFFVNLPIGVATALVSAKLLAADKGLGIGQGADVLGAVMVTAVLVAGQAVALVALAAIAAGPAHSDYLVHLLVPMALLGLGGGLSFPALTMIAMADVSPEDAGLASGLLNTTGEVGGAFGLAVLATIAGGRTLDMLNQGADLTVALSDGYHLAWMVCAGMLVLTLAAVVVLLRGKTTEQDLAVEGPCVECEAAA